MDLKSLYKISPGRRIKQLLDFWLYKPENFNNLSIGDNITCIEDRAKSSGGGYLAWNSGIYTKTKSITYGKSYKVVDKDIKRKQVKIISDTDKNFWLSPKRFIFSIKEQRKQKLEQIFKN